MKMSSMLLYLALIALGAVARAEDTAAYVGRSAPTFRADAVMPETNEFQVVDLSNYRGKYVVLFFYPLDFTFVCPTEIIGFSDRYDEFKALDAEVLGISIDSKYSHLAWIEKDRKEGGVGGLNYPLVSDLKREVATSYRVIDEDGVSLRGLFIIDKEGILQHSTINNLEFGRSVDETLRVLQAIKHVQQHPDRVCPLGWKPGDKGMARFWAWGR